MIKNGVLEIASDFIITKKTTTNELKKIENKYGIKPVTTNGNYESYITEPIAFIEQNVLITLYFEINSITRVTIYLLEPSSNGWSTDIELIEKNKKLLQDQWLLKLLKQPAPYNYSWGRVESIYDQRSCSSNIVISFY